MGTMEMFRGGPTEAEADESARQKKMVQLQQLEGRLRSVRKNLDSDSAVVGGNQITNLEESIAQIRRELGIDADNHVESTSDLRKLGDQINKRQ